MAHFLICYDHAYKDHPDYRSKLLKEALATTSWFLTANLTRTKICVNKKVSCFVFKNLCGSNKLWNFREILKYFLGQTRMLPEPWKTMRSVVNALLEGQNVEIILASVEPFCPDPAKHCGKIDRRRRSISSLGLGLDVLKATYLVPDGGLKGRIRKRAIDPLQMMDLFNKMLCNQEITVAIAEYYQENYKNIGHSRVWPIKNISPIWCCLVENMEELYRNDIEF